ncbi:CatA-like O-acetyltransferase [Pedobacter sp. UYP1]|uniref:CatA-like O-acetyltransferase n=1 Tax=Pedobacter sp. UYP1 TaxID=1756396 RepID=UPI003397BDB1
MEILTKDNKSKIDLANWKRKDHYNFFRKFDQPFFGISTELNCTLAYQYCKTYHTNFFMFYLYKAHLAVNHIPEFRYRIEDNEVFEYHQVSGSVTVLRKDETFGFAYFDHRRDFSDFMPATRNSIELEKNSSGLDPKAGSNGVIHYSVLPLIKFSGMQHAQILGTKDSVPKIAFGKLDFRDGQVFLPLSIHVHHALCDGLHLSRFIEYFQKQLELN